MAGFGLVPLREEGQSFKFDPSAPEHTAVDRAEIEALNAAQEAQRAAYTPFAKKWAAILNGGEDPSGRGQFGWYEVSHEDLIEDLMRVEAALRAEIANGGVPITKVVIPDGARG